MPLGEVRRARGSGPARRCVAGLARAYGRCSPGRVAFSLADRIGIICINMVHISPWEATVGLIKGAAAILPPASPLYLYGPYKREGFAMVSSNQAFDRSLRDRNSNWVCETSKRLPRWRAGGRGSLRIRPRPTGEPLWNR